MHAVRQQVWRNAVMANRCECEGSGNVVFVAPQSHVSLCDECANATVATSAEFAILAMHDSARSGLILFFPVLASAFDSAARVHKYVFCGGVMKRGRMWLVVGIAVAGLGWVQAPTRLMRARTRASPLTNRYLYAVKGQK